MKPTGKQLIAYIRLFNQLYIISEYDRGVFPGQVSHELAVKKGYIRYKYSCWRLTTAGNELLMRMHGDLSSYCPRTRARKSVALGKGYSMGLSDLQKLTKLYAEVGALVGDTKEEE